MKTPIAEIISVGNELVCGAYVDLNASRLARGLLNIGIETKHFSTVPDEKELLSQAIQAAASRASIILVTGGLGPTEDDITRHAAADAISVPLEFDESLWKAFQENWKKRGLHWTVENKLPAMFPKGATVLPNGAGTAPGFCMQVGEATSYFLPGPPGEAEQMLETHILPELSSKFSAKGAFFQRRLHMIGIPESAAGEKMADRMQRGRNPQVGTTVRKGILTISVFAKADNADAAKKLVDQEAEEIREIFPKNIFGEDGKTLPEAIGELLIEKKISVATAESCTGGLVGKLLTDIPGISQVYKGGFVTYSNELKNSALGVSKDLLDQYGAVSEEVAIAMAEGAAKATGAQAAISTTGIAGPDGGTKEKPVGLVYRAVFFQGITLCEKRTYPPRDRKRIRELAARDSLNLLRRVLLDQSG